MLGTFVKSSGATLVTHKGVGELTALQLGSLIVKKLNVVRVDLLKKALTRTASAQTVCNREWF